jgi:hypothetical protein
MRSRAEENAWLWRFAKLLGGIEKYREGLETEQRLFLRL